MARYIDGFVHPIPRSKLAAYQRLALAVAEIWKKHGALEYWEAVGDDLDIADTASFTDLVDATENEAVLFGWVLFESRQARDVANNKVAADPQMQTLMASIDVGFNAKRMAYGGFRPLVPAEAAPEPGT